VRFKECFVISVIKKTEKEFNVTVQEGASQTNHSVTVDNSYYRSLTGKKISKEELITISFKFLLDHEQKESILPKFNLRVIQDYFPGYEKTIKTSM